LRGDIRGFALLSNLIYWALEAYRTRRGSKERSNSTWQIIALQES